METPVLIIAAVLFVLGMLVRKYPNLIAGYNTMTAEQKKNVDHSANVYLQTEIIFPYKQINERKAT